MPLRRFTTLLVLMTALIASGTATSSVAGTISLAWDPVDHPDLAGYRIYFDTAPDSFSESIDLGAVTEATLTGLADCTTYYVAVKAYDDDGAESTGFSNGVSGWARPVAGGASPSQIERNQTVDLVIDGTNFQSGATVTFTDPGITVHGVTVASCSQLVANISVASDALVGPGDIRVQNPDNVYGVGIGLFEIVGDATAPVISDVEAGPVGATSALVSWTTDEPSDSQVFFRKLGQTTYQSTPVDSTGATDHAVTLQGLVPETTYEFHVRSVDGSGNAATSGDNLTFETLSSSFTYLRFEAEAGLVSSPIESGEGADAFQGEWISLPSGTAEGSESDPAGTAAFGFHVPYSGSWQVWVRVAGEDQPGAWFEQVDGAGLEATAPSETADWQWVAGRIYELDEGLHSLTMGGKLGGSSADRILITDDPSFLPTEQPGDDLAPPEPAEGLSAASGEDQNTLSWTNPTESGPLTVVIRYRDDGSFPVSPADGFPLHEGPATPGAADSYEHAGLASGTTYFYSVFVVDESGNASDPASAEATPELIPPDVVQNLRRTDTE